MRLGAKATLVLAVTFVSGIVVGALARGSWAERHERGPGRPPSGGGRGAGAVGFVQLMEDVIQPRDSAQRAALRPFLEATDMRNRAIVDGARTSMRETLDSLRAALRPRLDDEQLARFDDFARRQPRDGRGPPGLDGRGGPGGGRGPPPGMGPPRE